MRQRTAVRTFGVKVYNYKCISRITSLAGLEVFALTNMEALIADTEKQWFAMRDLTRSNAKLPAYKMLDELKIENFTPMVQKLIIRHGKRERTEVPFMHDLLFVHDSRLTLDSLVESVYTFQYRFQKGRIPMTVRDVDMERFMKTARYSDTPRYLRPEEITPNMRKRCIRIIGGPLNDVEGTLLTVRGSKKKRLLVELPMLMAVSVEIEQPEYIQLL